MTHAPHGISYWLTATYDNYWTTSAFLAGSFINTPLPQNILNQGVLVRASDNPLWNTSALFDFHYDRFHFDPFIVYQPDYFFNTGVISTTVTKKNGKVVTVPPYISQPEQIAGAYWIGNVQAYEELGTNRNFIVGMRVTNIFDNTHDVAPCFSGGTGCFPFDGATSGVFNSPGYIYQNYTQSPRTLEFFGSFKVGNEPGAPVGPQPFGTPGP